MTKPETEATIRFNIMTPGVAAIPERTASTARLPTATLAIVGRDEKRFRALIVNMEDLSVDSVVEGNADELPSFAARIGGPSPFGAGVLYVNVDLAASPKWPGGTTPVPVPVPTPGGNGYPGAPFTDVVAALFRLDGYAPGRRS